MHRAIVRVRHGVRLAVALAIMLVSSLAAAQDGEGALSAPTLGRLCAALRQDSSGASRCRVAARAGGAGVRSAVLHLSDERHDALWLAARRGGRWRAILPTGTAYAYQELRGEIRLRSLRVRQLVPGGAPEIDAVVERWQATLDPPDACWLQRNDEVHRYVCERRDGDWRCLGLQVASEASRVVTLETPCAPPRAPATPGWAVALRFTRDEVEVAPVRGELPQVMRAWRGRHPLRRALVPPGAPPPLPTPPDSI